MLYFENQQYLILWFSNEMLCLFTAGSKIEMYIFTYKNLFSYLFSAVILPTIWRYLQTLEAPTYFLGLALSAFSLSGLLSGPLFGYWSDRTRTTKTIILLCNIFEIIGKSSIPHIILSVLAYKYYLQLSPILL